MTNCKRKCGHLEYVRLGNPVLDLKIWIFRFPIEHNLKTGFVADSTNWNLSWHGFPISEIRDEIRFQILYSTENSKNQILRSKSGFPNQTHPYFLRRLTTPIIRLIASACKGYHRRELWQKTRFKHVIKESCIKSPPCLNFSYYASRLLRTLFIASGHLKISLWE